jgi:hypothetical protein
MKPLLHSNAKPAHYNKEAESYDAFNEASSKQVNQLIETILKKHRVKTVLDLTCGELGHKFSNLQSAAMRLLELISIQKC